MSDAKSDRAAHFTRMKSFTELVASIAHDFNNLLVGVVCNAEMLQQYHPQTDAGLKCVEGILSTSEIVSDITARMLAFGGRQSGNKVPVDLNEIARPCVEALRAETDSVELTLTASVGLATTNADSGRIEHSLRQLVINAIEAVEEIEQPTVQVLVGSETLAEDSEPDNLFGGPTTPGDYVFIEVRDNGPGFPPSEIGRLIEPFQTTKRGRARGLGMAIVYSDVVFQHNGLLSVQSSSDGTSIKIMLPT